ncbi:unnamed protein product [Paramecium sonneborni]|uniref:Uncharacterized protein n=1 Tax=Paramecium sonneborni TaxID=65129 RepID=A0A8S1R9P7_9CILI|nr:unnamed protein product [Paramecium sonneborni]
MLNQSMDEYLNGKVIKQEFKEFENGKFLNPKKLEKGIFQF